MPFETIKILIVDDHLIVREGLKRILTMTDDIVVTGEAGTMAEALQRLGEQSFNLVMIDISLPDKNGLELLKRVKLEYPTLPILILSTYPENQYALQVLKLGAGGYLGKDAVSEHLISVIRIVAKGRKYISLELAEKLANQMQTKGHLSLHDKLSSREFQTLRLIASGKSLSEIAEELAISAKTVSTYRSRILSKINLRNNADITRYAVNHGLV